MVKTNKDLLEEIDSLRVENAVLQEEIEEVKESIDAMKSENIDALVIAHNKILKVYTEETSDKLYRILFEEMHEGAVTLSDNGTILFCNSYFANMVNLSLQKVIGKIFVTFIEDSAKEKVKVLLKKSTKNASKEEIFIHSNDGKKIPVLMSINAFSLENIFGISIILTDLTIQYEKQDRLKRRTKQLELKNEELMSANKELALQIEQIKKEKDENRQSKPVGK